MTIFNSIILLIVVILANVVGLHAQGRSRLRTPPPPQSPPPPPPAVTFDHFLLVLSWPPAFCNDIYIFLAIKEEHVFLHCHKIYPPRFLA